MRITPFDIQQKQFPMKFRGFHAEEVSSFLELIREELEDLLRENASLREQIQKTESEFVKFWDMQATLSRTLQESHQMAEECRIQARQEADRCLGKAQETSAAMVRDAYSRANRVHEDVAELKRIRRSFHEEMRKAMEDCRRYLHGLQEEALQESPEGGAPVRDEETGGREEKLLPDE